MTTRITVGDVIIAAVVGLGALSVGYKATQSIDKMLAFTPKADVTATTRDIDQQTLSNAPDHRVASQGPLQGDPPKDLASTALAHEIVVDRSVAQLLAAPLFPRPPVKVSPKPPSPSLKRRQEAVKATSAPPTPPPNLSLRGVVDGAQGRVALANLGSTLNRALRVGDAIGEWVVARIELRRLVIERAGTLKTYALRASDVEPPETHARPSTPATEIPSTSTRDAQATASSQPITAAARIASRTSLAAPQMRHETRRTPVVRPISPHSITPPPSASLR